MDDLITKVVRNAKDIAPEAWNAVFPDGMESHNYFKLIDESGFEGFLFYYIMICKEDDVVGIAPCFILNYPLDTTMGGLPKEIMAGIRKLLPALFTLKGLFCGSPIGEGKIGIVGHYRREAMDALLRGMEDLAKKENAPVLIFKDFFAEYKNVLDPAVGEGFFKVNSYPSVRIGIDFNSFDEYLKTLSAASRYDLRRKFKQTDKLAALDLDIADNADGIIDEIYGLYLQTYSKSKIKWGEIPKKFFAGISRHMKEKVRYFLWRINGKLVAFNLCLSYDDSLVSMYIGLDYSVAYKYYLYFTTFRDQINWCIQNNIKTFHSGEFAYEAKRRLGFSLVPKYYYVKHVNRLVNPFFKVLCFALKPGNFDKALKESASKQAYSA